ncbi:hypothetical protein ACCO45_000010 [Purpureocillium lilacinum]|uniref:Uncharacterized protein n=1 Tax=Purpureocillium lilacinum TaxID=33203 RepID=A0ACC4EBP7_PURLI
MQSLRTGQETPPCMQISDSESSHYFLPPSIQAHASEIADASSLGSSLSSSCAGSPGSAGSSPFITRTPGKTNGGIRELHSGSQRDLRDASESGNPIRSISEQTVEIKHSHSSHSQATVDMDAIECTSNSDRGSYCSSTALQPSPGVRTIPQASPARSASRDVGRTASFPKQDHHLTRDRCEETYRKEVNSGFKHLLSVLEQVSDGGSDSASLTDKPRLLTKTMVLSLAADRILQLQAENTALRDKVEKLSYRIDV